MHQQSVRIFLTAAAALALAPLGTAQIMHNGSFVGGVGYDRVTNEVIVVDSTANTVTFYDRATGAQTNQFPEPGTLAVAVDVDVSTGNLWVGDENETVYIMDRAGNTLSQFSVQPVITDLSALTYDPCAKTIWVSNDSSNIVAEFDARTGAPTGNSFMPQGSVDGDGITYNPVTRTFLMGEDTGDQILEVDRQGTLLGTYATAPVSPEGLALDTITGTVFVGNGLATPRAVFEVPNIVQAAPAGAVTDYGTACGGGNAAVSHWVRDDGASCAGFGIGYQSAAAPGGNVLFNIGASRQNFPLSFLGSNCTVYAFGDYGSVLFASNANGRVGLDIAVPPGASGFAIRFWFADVDVTSPGIVQGASQGIELVIQ